MVFFRVRCKNFLAFDQTLQMGFLLKFSRIGELMTEVVGKHNVTWIASAGNHGPALCTIGTPPDIKTNTIIGNFLFKINV